MKFRQARKIQRRHADLLGWPDSPYSRNQLRRASARMSRMFTLQRRWTCPFCGRQRFKQRDLARPCSFEGCGSHTHEQPHP
jgi:hypothetical protein